MTFIPCDDFQTFLFWRIGCVVPSSSEAYFSFFLSFRRCRRTADATKNHQTKLCSRYFSAALLSRIVPSVSSILLKATSTRSCDLEDLIPEESLLIFINITLCAYPSLIDGEIEVMLIYSHFVYCYHHDCVFLQEFGQHLSKRNNICKISVIFWLILQNFGNI